MDQRKIQVNTTSKIRAKSSQQVQKQTMIQTRRSKNTNEETNHIQLKCRGLDERDYNEDLQTGDSNEQKQQQRKHQKRSQESNYWTEPVGGHESNQWGHRRVTIGQN